MNREQFIKNWTVMEAFKNGEAIEYHDGDGKWYPAPNPAFYTEYEYRVKPKEPKIGSVLRSQVNANVIRTIVGETTVGGCDYWIVSKVTNPEKPAYMVRKLDLKLIGDGGNSIYQLI